MPPPDLALGGMVDAVDVGGSHAYALMSGTKAVRCWGYGGYGQLGYGDIETIGDEPGEVVVSGGIRDQFDSDTLHRDTWAWDGRGWTKRA